MSAALDRAARALARARAVTVLTGAGVSAESGVPTFREAQTGLWAAYDPEVLASPEGFERDPRTVWAWYRWRRELVTRAAPNAAHEALAALERETPEFLLLTQNVDGLHQRAGSERLLELHGSILRARCTAERVVFTDWHDIPDGIPICRRCGAMLRPDVVWFGEQLSESMLRAAHQATDRCEVFLSVGTSNVVQPAASLPWLAAARGATVIVVNTALEGQGTGPTVLGLEGPAAELLPELARRR